MPVRRGEPGQVLPYLLGLGLADMEFLADAAYSGNLASGKVVGEQLGCLMTLAVPSSPRVPVSARVIHPQERIPGQTRPISDLADLRPDTVGLRIFTRCSIANRRISGVLARAAKQAVRSAQCLLRHPAYSRDQPPAAASDGLRLHTAVNEQNAKITRCEIGRAHV